MPINEALIMELEQEAQSTRKLLERVPLDKADWKPHEKSFSLGRLATHVAEIPGWTSVTLDEDEMDFAKSKYEAVVATDTKQLLEIFDENYKKAMDTLKNMTDEGFMKNWTMRDGETVYFTLPKVAVMRTFVLNHWYHHRGQLTVNLRLLNVPLPGIYGPTADEQM